MNRFRDKLCNCSACGYARKALTKEQLDSPIVDLIQFDTAISKHSERFNIRRKDIHYSIIRLIFDQLLQQEQDYEEAS